MTDFTAKLEPFRGVRPKKLKVLAPARCLLCGAQLANHTPVVCRTLIEMRDRRG